MKQDKNPDSPQEKLFRNYTRKYLDFAASISKARLKTILARGVLKDFPRSLPLDLRTQVKEVVVHANRIINDPSISRIELDTGGNEELANAVSRLFSIQALKGIDGSPAFGKILWSEELVMIITLLDAFMVDSMRTIIRAQPAILNSEKSIKISEVLATKSWDGLLSYLTNEEVDRFGSLSVEKQVKALEGKPLNLSLQINKADLDIVNEAESVRHIIIHNGGKVNQQFIERTGKTDIGEGEQYPLGSSFVAKSSVSSERIALKVFDAISKKFLAQKNPTKHLHPISDI